MSMNFLKLPLLKLLLLSFGGLLSAPFAAQAQTEALISCRASNAPETQEYFISLTSVGNIVVERASSRESVLHMPIQKASQLVQNDNQGLQLIHSQKRMGMVYKEQKISVDYLSGKGKIEETSLAKGSPLVQLSLADCKKL